jgi:hypothetical protein
MHVAGFAPLPLLIIGTIVVLIAVALIAIVRGDRRS